MIKVGILPTTQIFQKDNPYNDIYTFYNVYAKCIYESGALPIGILLNDGKLNYESLKLCDALLICGGRKIEPYFLETINYAIKNNIPLLGVCLGMQSIGLYSYLETLLNKENQTLTVRNFENMYKKIKEKKELFLIPIDNHYNEKITRSNCGRNKHLVNINKGSKLYDIYGKKNMAVVSMHRYAVNKYGDNVLINCDCDGVIEGLEYKGNDLFVLGVQWHPELEEENKILFKTLVKEAKKRK